MHNREALTSVSSTTSTSGRAPGATPGYCFGVGVEEEDGFVAAAARLVDSVGGAALAATSGALLLMAPS